MARRATVEDVHRIAAGMPHVRRWPGTENAVYQVGGKSFVFFRNPRPDAFDPVTVSGTTTSSSSGWRRRTTSRRWCWTRTRRTSPPPHFDGHPSVLVRGSRIGEIDVDELTELIQDAWLSRASRRRAETWLADH